MNINLHELRVLVTRPDPQGEALCRMINAAHGTAIHFPVIAFAPPDDMAGFASAIKALGEQDWLIFISPQAVYSSVPALRQAWPELPPQVQFAAMGKGTAQALKEAGYNAALVPAENRGAEEFLDLPPFKSCKGMKAAVIRGQGGRELIDNELAVRGARVLSVLCYKRVLPTAPIQPVLKLLAAHKIDVLVCSSFEGVKNLKTLMGEEYWLLLKKIPLCTASERIKKLANDLGFETIWVPHEMSDASIVQLLALLRKE